MADAKVHSLHCRLDDISNGDASDQCHKCPHQHSPECDDSPTSERDKDSEVDEDERQAVQDASDLRHAGRCFVLIKQLWPSSKWLYTTVADKDYDLKHRFKDVKKKLQGDVHNLLDVVPARFHSAKSLLATK